MGNKWSTTTITGYNADPPTDDGAVTENNRVKYSTITTNLSNPLKSSLTTVIAKLDELFSITTLAKSAPYTTVASDHTKVIEVTGTTTITLLAAATAGAGYRTTIKNAGTNIVTVDGNGAETIDGAANIALAANASVDVVINAAGTGWLSKSQSTGLMFAATDEILFRGTATPVGWTIVSQNDKALRVVSGTPSSGGATAFTSVFGAGKTTGAEAAHTHTFTSGNTSNGTVACLGGAGNNVTPEHSHSGTTAAGSSHTHTLSLDLHYYDMNVITKT